MGEQEWLARLLEQLAEYGLWVQLGALLLGALASHVAARVVLHFLLQRAERSKAVWDDLVIKAARPPLLFFIWLLAASWAVQLMSLGYSDSLVGAMQLTRKLGTLLLLAWFLTRLVRQSEQVLTSASRMRKPMDVTTVSAVGRLLRLTVFILVGLVVLQSLGYSISGILAFGGIGGLAVGFAAKDLLANFFGALMIYLDRPFKVGDWIRSPDQQIEGIVEEIGWRQTRIRTFDKRPLYVPNATFTHISVENPSRMTNRRIYEYIGVRYDDADKVQAIIDAVREMLRGHPDIDPRQTLIVNLDRFGPSSLDFFIYSFTRTTNWERYHEVKQDVLCRVMDIVLAHGAEIAFPTTTVHLYRAEPEQLPAVEPVRQERQMSCLK
ncbi:mechanosensitive ion channel family protein [Marinobacterium arenosum]|uniref:mechanosensitive ion channel family protein n=1 Tax=Marinobacterium arenosum TaxID=2862496 RepID=UPI001C977C8E|nr:mechanosensitive ion channel family protein [Marinobacterium arenosum]MBY4677265.1 mechanosensitive ion channel family protein [Marinobacterium arenosum]